MAKIAIHYNKRSWAAKWIEVCKEKNVDFEIVNGFSSDIVNRLNGFDAFLWHFSHWSPTEIRTGKNVISSAEKIGLVCVPNKNVIETFDDKVAQKYLFESLGIPHARSEVFYDRQTALNWLDQCEYPFVFKLARGAGSANVKLVKSRAQALKLIGTAFGKGFKPMGTQHFADLVSSAKRQKNIEVKKIIGKALKAPSILRAIFFAGREFGREKGYFYCQEFIPNNSHDTRVTIIGNRAFGFRRSVRKGDFRASGSGYIDHNHKEIDVRCIQIAFELARKTCAYPIAVDFVFDERSEPKVIEISYGFSPGAVFDCEGYWSDNLDFVRGNFSPERCMIEDTIDEIQKKQNSAQN